MATSNPHGFSTRFSLLQVALVRSEEKNGAKNEQDFVEKYSLFLSRYTKKLE